MQKLFFHARASALWDAAILLREAIGQIKSLNYSLIGKNPTRTDINIYQHVEIRRFFTEEGLESFVTYMEELMTNSSLDRCSFRRLDEGFSFEISSKAYIEFRKVDCVSGWDIKGWATFKDSGIIRKNLGSKGFSATPTPINP